LAKIWTRTLPLESASGFGLLGSLTRIENLVLPVVETLRRRYRPGPWLERADDVQPVGVQAELADLPAVALLS
jgi:hypothetical protein